MNRFPLRLVPEVWRLVSIGCFVFLSVTPNPVGSTQPAANHSWDIAVIDRALAGAKPTDPWVKFGDVGIKYADLKVYRDRLAGTTSQPSREGKPSPEVVTPPGTTFKWPSGNVNYRFDPTQVTNGTITAVKEQQFRDGVGEWAAFANLHFIEFTGTPPANFITVQESASGEGGFSSSVGMAGGEQFIQIGPHSWNRGTICHEVGHALGLYHEQQRSDRDTYVVINTNNINTNDQPNFAIISNGQTFSTAYDFYSVMHYSRTALTNKTGTPNPNAPDPTIDTIDPQPAYVQFLNVYGQVYDRTLSKIERAGMGAIYGTPSVAPSAIVTNTNDSGPGSLRAAIYFAFDRSTDSTPTPTTITFNIPTSDPNYNSSAGVFTIKPTYLMTSPGDGTTIDGTTQTAFTGDTNPNGPEIVLDGSTQKQYETVGGVYGPAFILRQANCTIKGLVIANYDNQGIQITSNAKLLSVATGNVVTGCYIGTDKNGSAGMPNGIDMNGVNNHFPAIEIFGGANNNTIGGTTVASRNVISGSAGDGVLIHDTGSTNNVIEGNYIGLTAAGTATLANSFNGVEIYNGANNNVIGGTVSGTRNVISGNTDSGVIINACNGTLVQGNYIGTDPTGAVAMGNSQAGIYVFAGASNTTIGGTITGAGNVISGNTNDGVDLNGASNSVVQGNYIGVDVNGTAAKANSTGLAIFGGGQSNTVGGMTAAARNIISGNKFSGVSIGGNGTNNNFVQGNYIGVNPTGSTAQPNGGDGVAIYGDGPAPSPSPTPAPNRGAQFNTIGGTAAGARNIISGNTGNGVSIGNPGSTGTNNNLVQGNYIGVDSSGSNAAPNQGAGVNLYGGAQSNTIGGTSAAARNIISGNKFQGVAIGGLGGSLLATIGPSQNTVAGNYIGLNAAGSPLGNGSAGVLVFGAAQSNTVGGAILGARNVISANAFQDVVISDPNTKANTVLGNYIGLDATGTTPVVGTNTSGVGIQNGAQNNVVGGTSDGSRNFICGHQSYGMYFADAGTTGNSAQGNTIGLNPAGSNVPNFRGVAFFNSSQSNTVGGSTVGASNIISGNTNEGIAVFSSGSTTIKETFSRNSIFANGGKGIALYNGGNNSQPFPTLSSATLSTPTNWSGTDIVGSLTATANTNYTIEFFASPTGDSSGFGQGQFFVGSAGATTNAAGTAAFTMSLAAAIPVNYVIAATATDPNGNTSEFSADRTVTTTDTDGDGIPDNWMIHYFMHPTGMASDNSRATDDADGTGMTNLQKFLAGLDPKNPNSVFRISSVSMNAGSIQIGFPSITSKTYQLQYRDDLVAGDWNILLDQIFGTGTTMQITDPTAAGVSKRFYRLRLEP